jgi:hypothetical protein
MSFEKIQGHSFTFEGVTYRLEVGVYSANFEPRAAIIVWRWDDGTMEDKLTVNLMDEPLGEGEFFVPLTEEHERTRRMCEATGLFERTGRVVGSGRVERYAEAWRLR